MVHHLCPSSIALPLVVQFAYLIRRLSNAIANQPHLCACLAIIGPTKRTRQLVLHKMPQRVMHVYQQLHLGYELSDIHPKLGQVSHSQEKDLQFISTCPINFPQLFNSVTLIHILGKPAHPEVANQWLVLSYVSCTPHAYSTLAGLTKPLPIIQASAAGLRCAVPKVAVVALVAEYYGGQIIVLPTLYT